MMCPVQDSKPSLLRFYMELFFLVLSMKVNKTRKKIKIHYKICHIKEFYNALCFTQVARYRYILGTNLGPS